MPSITQLITISIALFVISIVFNLWSALASIWASRRQLGERIIVEEVVETKEVYKPFPNNKLLDLDYHMLQLFDHIEKYGLEGTPDNVHTFLNTWYGVDYAKVWWRDNKGKYHYDGGK